MSRVPCCYVFEPRIRIRIHVDWILESVFIPFPNKVALGVFQ